MRPGRLTTAIERSTEVRAGSGRRGARRGGPDGPDAARRRLTLAEEAPPAHKPPGAAAGRHAGAARALQARPSTLHGMRRGVARRSSGASGSADAIRIPLEERERWFAENGLEPAVRASRGCSFLLPARHALLWSERRDARRQAILSCMRRLRPQSSRRRGRLRGHGCGESPEANLIPLAERATDAFGRPERRPAHEWVWTARDRPARSGHAADEVAGMEFCNQLSDSACEWPVIHRDPSSFDLGVPSLMRFAHSVPLVTCPSLDCWRWPPSASPPPPRKAG